MYPHILRCHLWRVRLLQSALLLNALYINVRADIKKKILFLHTHTHTFYLQTHLLLIKSILPPSLCTLWWVLPISSNNRLLRVKYSWAALSCDLINKERKFFFFQIHFLSSENALLRDISKAQRILIKMSSLHGSDLGSVTNAADFMENETWGRYGEVRAGAVRHCIPNFGPQPLEWSRKATSLIRSSEANLNINAADGESVCVFEEYL